MMAMTMGSHQLLFGIQQDPLPVRLASKDILIAADDAHGINGILQLFNDR